MLQEHFLNLYVFSGPPFKHYYLSFTKLIHIGYHFLLSQKLISMKMVDIYKNECLFPLWQTLLTKVSTWLFIEGVLVQIPYYLVGKSDQGEPCLPSGIPNQPKASRTNTHVCRDSDKYLHICSTIYLYVLKWLILKLIQSIRQKQAHRLLDQKS